MLRDRAAAPGWRSSWSGWPARTTRRRCLRAPRPAAAGRPPARRRRAGHQRRGRGPARRHAEDRAVDGHRHHRPARALLRRDPRPGAVGRDDVGPIGVGRRSGPLRVRHHHQGLRHRREPGAEGRPRQHPSGGPERRARHGRATTTTSSGAPGTTATTPPACSTTRPSPRSPVTRPSGRRSAAPGPGAGATPTARPWRSCGGPTSRSGPTTWPPSPTSAHGPSTTCWPPPSSTSRASSVSARPPERPRRPVRRSAHVPPPGTSRRPRPPRRHHHRRRPARRPGPLRGDPERCPRPPRQRAAGRPAVLALEPADVERAVALALA